jgi:putative phosphoesterase
VGVVGDTHDQTGLVEVVADVFREAGVERVVHAGDVVSPRTVEPLETFDLVVVEGNGDDRRGLRARAEAEGWTCTKVWRGTHEGESLAAVHGHRPRKLEALLDEEPDWLFRGHNHRPRDETRGATRVVNPGALWRVRVPSAAVVDVEAGEVTFHVLEDGAARAIDGLPEAWGW